MSTQLATFAGGCFWCIETPFKHHKGVLDAVLGYMDGRESAQLTFDPSVVTYAELLDLFWLQIDPTDSGGQFYDRGHEYTTAIYCHTPEQKKLAEDSKQLLEKSKKYSSPIATLILSASEFFPAEEYHQDFAAKNPERYKQFKKLSGRAAFIEKNKQA